MSALLNPRLMLPLLLLALTGCAEDKCTSEAPAFQVDLVMSASGSVANITALSMQLQVGELNKTQSLNPQILKARGRTSVAVVVGNPGTAGFNATVEARALNEEGQPLASGRQTFSGTGDACNFFELPMLSGDLPDGGQPGDGGQPKSERHPGDGPAVNLEGGNPKDLNISCSGNDCVRISGQLSGLVDYTGKRVLIEQDISLSTYNGVDDLDSCDPGETGCLKIIADEIILQAGVILSGSGCGQGGGGGGGGGPGYPGGTCSHECNKCSAGAAGAGQGKGKAGNPGASISTGSRGGAGGQGGGKGGGGPGHEQISESQEGPRDGIAGGPGGYNQPGENTDSTTDESVRMGSGGGGGGGGASAAEHNFSSVGGSGGGGGGNMGGGKIELIAGTMIILAGEVQVNGWADRSGHGGDGTDGSSNNLPCDIGGDGGRGGDANASGTSAGGQGVNGFFQVSETNSCNDRVCGEGGSKSVSGGDGGKGGAGSGGGVLIKAPTVEIYGAINSLGGGNVKRNGGTVKIFHQGAAPATTGVSAGRLLVKTF